MANYNDLRYKFAAENLTDLNATNLGSGTVPTARLGSGTANSTVHLRGDGTWAAAGGGKMIQHKRYIATNAYTQSTNDVWAGFDNFTTISATSSTNKFYAIGTWPTVRWCGNGTSAEPTFYYGIASTTDGGDGSANGGWSGTEADAGGSGNNICRTNGGVSARLESTNCANDHLGGNFVVSAMWTTGSTTAVGIGRCARVTTGCQYTSYNGWGGQQAGTIHMFELEP